MLKTLIALKVCTVILNSPAFLNLIATNLQSNKSRENKAIVVFELILIKKLLNNNQNYL